MKTNKKDAFNEIHKLISEQLINQLKGDKVSPQLLKAAMTFLKDNGVAVDPEQNEKLQMIKDSFTVKVGDLPFGEEEDEELVN